MSKAKRKKNPPTPPAFTVGQQVRVRRGVQDADYPDLPLGGWTGTVVQVNRLTPPTYLIEWDRRTLEDADPVYRKRCERDGLDFNQCCLGEDDIEPATGEPAHIEQPTDMVTRPLNEDDEEDRIRVALGLTSDDPLPEVDTETLKQYHKYLVTYLTFPFKATVSPEEGPALTVSITGLLDPDEYDCTEHYGLICHGKQGEREVDVLLGELEADEKTPNGLLVSDYLTWFWNWR